MVGGMTTMRSGSGWPGSKGNGRRGEDSARMEEEVRGEQKKRGGA